MAMVMVHMCAILLCLVLLFGMSRQQAAAAGRATRDLVPLATPLEETESSQSESFSGTENVANCSNCCANFSCMYDLVVDGLKASEEFEALGNLLYLSGDEIPVFVPIQANLTLMECNSSISIIKEESMNYSYVWGRNPTYATFGPVQEFFQSVTLFDPIIKFVALFEQWFVLKEDLNEDYLEDWVIEHNQTLTVDISGLGCISDLYTPNKTLNDTLKFVIAEALTKIEQLTVEGSEFHSNSSGHVLSLDEVKLVINVFTALYVCSWVFLVCFLVFVGLFITSTKLWKEKVNSGQTCQIFYSITVVVVLLSLCDTTSSIVLFAMKVIHVNYNKPVGFMKDTTKRFVYQYKPYLYAFLAIRAFTTVFFVISFTVIYVAYCCKKKQKVCSREAIKPFSGFFLLLYIFMTLFQLVPVMSHMVMYPIRTFSIIVQYLCSLFIMVLFAYQFVMCSCQLLHFPCTKSLIRYVLTRGGIEYQHLQSQRNGQEEDRVSTPATESPPPPSEKQAPQTHSGTQATPPPPTAMQAPQPHSGTQATPPPPTAMQAPGLPAETWGLQLPESTPTHDAYTYCTYMMQACMSLFGLVLILLIGFLYFAVTFMGVNPATLTMFVIGIMTAIMSTTISGRLNKCFDKL